MAATALAGSSTSPLTVMVTSAVQSSSSSSIDSTRPTGHVGDADAGLRHEVEHVEELHLDGVRVVADVGAAGQAQRGGAPEAAAAEQHHCRRGRGQPLCPPHHGATTAGSPGSALPPPPPPPPPPSSACRSSS